MKSTSNILGYTAYSLHFSSSSLKSQQNLMTFFVLICFSYNRDAFLMTESMILRQNEYSMFKSTLYFFSAAESSSARFKSTSEYSPAFIGIIFFKSITERMCLKVLSASTFFHVLCLSFADDSGITYSMLFSCTRIPMYGFRS